MRTPNHATKRRFVLPPCFPGMANEAGKQISRARDPFNLFIFMKKTGAGEAIRTPDPNLGNWFGSLSPAPPIIAEFTNYYITSIAYMDRKSESATLRFAGISRPLLPPCFPGHAAPAWGSRMRLRGPPEPKGKFERNDEHIQDQTP